MPLLLLDLDNTLVDRDAAFRAWGALFLADLGAPAYDLDWLVDADADGMTSRWDLADAIKERYRLRTSVVDIVDELHEGQIASTKFDPMVGAALRIAADAGWVPVIVTNGETRQQEAKIRHTGLDRFVADWVISQEVDCRKPNPRIFEIAAERVRMRLRGAWMIGDGPEADIGGATTIGIPSVWIHRGRRWVEPRFGPTRVADGAIQAVAEVLAADPQYRMR
ncbi:HAD family hydrolase [Catelliglobosispora koreensis]|uniref:HAD family hydrolase n=1 Tax=Catelliglobosispora koreensis TaxID=129052 RepID=UPI0003752FCC|nr:HAD family hydrolase [Catelliglobosispora koreensis]